MKNLYLLKQNKKQWDATVALLVVEENEENAVNKHLSDWEGVHKIDYILNNIEVTFLGVCTNDDFNIGDVVYEHFQFG